MDFRQCFQLVTSVGCSPARPSYLTVDKIITDKVDYIKKLAFYMISTTIRHMNYLYKVSIEPNFRLIMHDIFNNKHYLFQFCHL